jgi:adenosylmethionine-8-amino-7-oxononanoate aminotransferase
VELELTVVAATPKVDLEEALLGVTAAQVAEVIQVELVSQITPITVVVGGPTTMGHPKATAAALTVITVLSRLQGYKEKINGY